MTVPKDLQDWLDSLPPGKKYKSPYAAGRKTKLTDEEVDDLRRLIGVEEVYDKVTKISKKWP